MKLRLSLVMLTGIVFFNGCATAPTKPNYDQFRTENPRSMLVVPAINRSVEVDAPDYLLATISKPLGERGYYVFPVHLVKSVMEMEGLSDANMVHSNEPQRLGKLFGADAILYITIERWDAKYAVLSTTTTVGLSYILKSSTSGETLWANNQVIEFTPDNSNAGLLGMLILAAIQKAKPNYLPLAQQANVNAVNTKGYGIPAGPYDSFYRKDTADY